VVWGEAVILHAVGNQERLIGKAGRESFKNRGRHRENEVCGFGQALFPAFKPGYLQGAGASQVQQGRKIIHDVINQKVDFSFINGSSEGMIHDADVVRETLEQLIQKPPLSMIIELSDKAEAVEGQVVFQVPGHPLEVFREMQGIDLMGQRLSGRFQGMSAGDHGGHGKGVPLPENLPGKMMMPLGAGGPIGP
jgi:hypothetical protein